MISAAGTIGAHMSMTLSANVFPFRDNSWAANGALRQTYPVAAVLGVSPQPVKALRSRPRATSAGR